MPQHNHHGGPVTGKRLGLSIGLTSAFVCGEAAAGYWANSLALLSDAGHNLADALALAVSWYAIRMARRPADAHRTYGYHRAGILAALVNAVALVAIAGVTFWEAAKRFRAPEPVQSNVVVGVAAVAVVLNALISVWLHAEAQHDLNIRSAYLHMLGDALSALGVAAAGVTIWLTGEPLADPAVSVLIGALILWSSWRILKQSVNVLLEGVPEGFDVAALRDALSMVPGVLAVHDLHVWAVSSGITACSCHLVVAGQSARSGQRVMQAAADVMRERFRVTHTTIQVEVEGCGLGGMHCQLWGPEAENEGHSHTDGHDRG